MDVMVWDAELAPLSATTIEVCVGITARVAEKNTNVEHNLFYTNDTRTNLTQVVNTWFNYEANYNYDTVECAAGRTCKPYLNIMWGTINHIGCAYHRCPPGTKTATTTANFFLQCNYWPAEITEGKRPFTRGPVCMKCASGSGWCKDNLCNKYCSRYIEDCWCGAICQYGGVLNNETCQCSCADGWLGTDCSIRCEDMRYCNASFAFSPRFCYEKEVQKDCPAMCGLCFPAPDTVDNEARGQNKGGAKGQRIGIVPRSNVVPIDDAQFDSAQPIFIKCYQPTMIFVMVIITFIINSYDDTL